MAMIPMFSLFNEAPPSAPPPKPRRPALPPRPLAQPAREEPPEPRPAPRQPQPQRAASAMRGAAPASTKAATRQAAERDQRDAGADAEQALPGQGGQWPLPPQAGGGGGGQQGDTQDEGEQERGGSGGASTALAGGELDCDMLAGLLPTAGDDGIFEVLLPDGARLGVAVDVGEHHVAYLLSPSSEQFRAQINNRKMELQKALMQRMQTDVRLTVL
ncbi:hypothetical protein [Herbaspirillum sp. alder98]|uniref:hypothetical protein n=1 Tax=Herbaspirillum sp. alder98 TaxID=2913096 RepID=UPI001CD8CBB3|nr:hypothetical protein [Herbaspirillum sp. alder98]MCA1325661.1 hypothetical protein [Herbaspirillum sp. alder98]